MKPISIIGMGQSGQACARWLRAQGQAYLAFDDRAEFELPADGAQVVQWGVDYHDPAAWLPDCESIVISPGLSPIKIQALLQYAKARAIEVRGELDLFADALVQVAQETGQQAQVVVITGTNGKTTTTRLTAALLNGAGVDACAAGNISPALLDAALERWQKNQWPQVWVLELSSFQLHYSQRLKPNALALLNVTEDHLDWHADMNEYVMAKLKCLHADCDLVVPHPSEAPELHSYLALRLQQLSPVRQIFIQSELGSTAAEGDNKNAQRYLISHDQQQWAIASDAKRQGLSQAHTWLQTDELQLLGRHNQINALFALALVNQTLARIEPARSLTACLPTLRSFTADPHRCTKIATIDGVDYIDDSKGTNVGATLAALDSFAQIAQQRSAGLWLILGGIGKGQDFAPLGAALNHWHQQVAGVALIGQDAALIAAALPASVSHVIDGTLAQAVSRLAQLARAGDQVLLSPACSSFDQFTGFKARGVHFGVCVNGLIAVQQGVGR